MIYTRNVWADSIWDFIFCLDSLQFGFIFYKKKPLTYSGPPEKSFPSPIVIEIGNSHLDYVRGGEAFLWRATVFFIFWALNMSATFSSTGIKKSAISGIRWKMMHQYLGNILLNVVFECLSGSMRQNKCWK